MPRRGLVRFAPHAEHNNNTTTQEQLPRRGPVRFAANAEHNNTTQELLPERNRHCTYCRKYHTGVCIYGPKIGDSTSLNHLANEFDPLSLSTSTSSSVSEAPSPAEDPVELNQRPELLAQQSLLVDSMGSIEAAVNCPERVRNLAIIAHVDHGKTTIADRLLAKASMLRDQDVAKSCKMDTGKLEQEKGITIKATSTGLLYPDEQLLINLVDCPGHVDFNGEVSAALRVTDGALLVVDCIEGVCVQTEQVLRQALQEGVQPILFLNKLDRAITELQLEPEHAYIRLVSTIEAVNCIVREYHPQFELCPSKDNVIFGSGLFGWGFTLQSLARARGLQLSSRKLWGDRYYDKETSSFVKHRPSETTERTFVSMVLQPLYRLHEIGESDDESQLAAFVKRHGLPAPAAQPRCKDMVRAVLRQWLPCGDTIVGTAAEHLPSPVAAQHARVATLGSGLEGSDAYDAIQACDPNGPLIVYITKLAPMGKAEGKKLIALGRVFSGTVRPGDKVTVIDAQHGDRHSARIERVKMMMIDKRTELASAPAGSLIGLVGVQHVGTVVQDPTFPPMCGVALSVSPVVSVAVRPKKQSDIVKVVEKLRELVKTDNTLCIEHDRETGEHCLIGTGELHMQSALHDLGELLPDGVSVLPSEPSVRVRETVSIEGQVCLAKSSNKHNRIYARAVPLSPEVESLLETGTLTPQTEEKRRSEMLAELGWDRTEARRKVLRISGNNILVDCTDGLNVSEILEHLSNAFDSVMASGVLTSSPVSGVRMEIHNGTRWHQERVHRGPAQMVEPARRAFLASLLTAQPLLCEPILEVKVQVPEKWAQKVCSVLKLRRGIIIGYESDRLVTVLAHVPVDASFGMSSDLRKETSGYAFPQCAFSEWKQIPGYPTQPNTLAGSMLNKTRTRKMLPEDLPTLKDLADKL